jgi:hypothetical protein
MKKRLPKLTSDDGAVQFVPTADLTKKGSV